MRLLDKSSGLRGRGLRALQMRDIFEEIVVKPTAPSSLWGRPAPESTTLYASLNQINRRRSTSSRSRIGFYVAHLAHEARRRTCVLGSPAARSPTSARPLMCDWWERSATPRRPRRPSRPPSPVTSCSPTLHERRPERPDAAERRWASSRSSRARRVTAVLAQRLAEALHALLRDVHGHGGEGLECRLLAPAPALALAAMGSASIAGAAAPAADDVVGLDRAPPAHGHERGREPARRAQHASREELERAALEIRDATPWDYGLSKVVSGLTSLEELARSSRAACLLGGRLATAVPPGCCSGLCCVLSRPPAASATNTPCVLASERPSHPGDERRSAWNSS